MSNPALRLVAHHVAVKNTLPEQRSDRHRPTVLKPSPASWMRYPDDRSLSRMKFGDKLQLLGILSRVHLEQLEMLTDHMIRTLRDGDALM